MAIEGASISAAAIRKAQVRADALGMDLNDLSEQMRGAHPADLTSRREQEERRRFLESLYDGSREAAQRFERIIAGNELQQANFLPRGALAARAVLRVVIRGTGGVLLGYGTGFLIGHGVLLTNNHVLQTSDAAALSSVEAFYEQGVDGNDLAVQRFALEPGRLFHTSKELDFSIVAVAPTAQNGPGRLVDIGWLPLIGSTGKALEGEWLTIIQHPRGEPKQLCVRENQLLKKDTDVLWYSTDTLGGSSGSPVFNNDWLVVALHHSGVPETRNGRWQTIDGRDFDPARDDESQIKWVANEGIRVSRIIETLRTDARVADHPLVRAMLGVEARDISLRLPILFGDGAPPPASLLSAADQLSASARQPVPAMRPTNDDLPSGETDMSEHLVKVTLAISADGSVRIVDSTASEAALVSLEKAASPKPVVDAPVEEEKDWGKGFVPGFLDSGEPELSVHLPILSAENQARIARLKPVSVYGKPAPAQAEIDAGVLDYWGYSIVMNAERRLAFFSAANIDWGGRYELSRSADKWLWDDRIDRKHQIGNSFYVGNKFDRGHLTRREDLESGPDPVQATRKANGTCTWPNCSPQHEVFNQDKNFPGKAAALWGGLEKYILEQTALHNQFRIHSITGPIFGDDDPVYRDVKVPLSFWKVVAAINADGKLFATGYVLSQDFLVERDWGRLDEAALEQPFGKFETYQTRISEIEKETGLSFTFGTQGKSLSDCDPLAKPSWRQRGRRRGVATGESFGLGGGRPGGPLEGFGDIVLG